MHVSDRNRGYFQALYGMLLTMKNSDRYSFLPTIDFTNKKQLKSYRKEFLDHMESRLHDEYDRGYFEAWSDYMKILPRMETPAQLNNKNAARQTEETGTQEVPTEVNAPADATATSEEAPTEDAPEEKSARSSQSLIVDHAG
jgi:hypothetical protein